jgi:hypothetical protein
MVSSAGGQRRRRLVPLLSALAVVASCTSYTGPQQAEPASSTRRTVSTITDRNSSKLRSFVVRSLTFRANQWWTIGVHPSAVPIRVQPSSSVDVCPAALEGSLDGPGSWPSSTGFRSCLPADHANDLRLPGTSGHVAFAIRSRGGGTVEAVTITYDAVDAFVEVIPPPSTTTTVGFMTTSATMGAHAYLLPGFRSAPVQVTIEQAGRRLTRLAECDFGSEISCVGGAIANAPVIVRMQGQPASIGRVALYLSWS